MVEIPERLNVYVPKPDSHLAAQIKVGSGIVGSAEGDGVCIDFEGNLYGADNIKTYADRVMRAADRHLWRYPKRYPTAARLHLQVEADELIYIGSYYLDSGTLTIEVDAEVCAHWIDVTDYAQLQLGGAYSPRKQGFHPKV